MNTLASRWCALSFSVLSFAAVAADKTLLVPPDEIVEGRTQAQWSVAWWQWAASFSNDASPVADSNGSRCQLKQGKGVWFLAGTYGTGRTIRSCTIPAGTHLFFPLVNYVLAYRAGTSFTCAQAKQDAANLTEHPAALVLEVDGKVYKDLVAHRQASPDCFDLAQLSGGEKMPAAASGYYVMLRPLRRGSHTLNFGGILPDMTQAVTYTLHVQ